MKSLDSRLITALVTAAEKEGGIHMLELPNKRRCWHRCVSMGHLWYNNSTTHSSNVVKIEKCIKRVEAHEK